MASEYSQGKKHLQRGKLALLRTNERLQDCWIIYRESHPEFAEQLKALAQVGEALRDAIEDTITDLGNLK